MTTPAVDGSYRKVQVKARPTHLPRWDPKRYGDKIDVNATHSEEICIVIGGYV